MRLLFARSMNVCLDCSWCGSACFRSLIKVLATQVNHLTPEGFCFDEADISLRWMSCASQIKIILSALLALLLHRVLSYSSFPSIILTRDLFSEQSFNESQYSIQHHNTVYNITTQYTTSQYSIQHHKNGYLSNIKKQNDDLFMRSLM